jgi:hypothetical protein
MLWFLIFALFFTWEFHVAFKKFKLKVSMLQAAFFLDPNQDCVVKCLESCCSETSPPRYDKTFSFLRSLLSLSSVNAIL